jgi:hypothetical protein
MGFLRRWQRSPAATARSLEEEAAILVEGRSRHAGELGGEGAATARRPLVAWRVKGMRCVFEEFSMLFRCGAGVVDLGEVS